MTRFPFTTERLRKLPTPPRGRLYYHDSRTPSLCLSVTEAGSKTFYRYGRINGQPKRIRLGRFPEVSIADARAAVAEIAGQIARGRDPAAQRKAERESATLEMLFEHWWTIRSAPHKKTARDDRRIFTKYLGRHARRRLSTISKADVTRWHAELGRVHGRYQANRVLALLSALYGLAADLGHQGGNPCLGVRRFAEASRERFLQPSELPAFLAAVAEEPQPWKDYIVLLLLTGLRRSNLAAAKWDQVDLDRGVLYVPSNQAKGGLPLAVPLCNAAQAILRARRAADPDGQWLFPSTGRNGHLADPRKSWERIRQRSGLADLRLHDLRRSLASWPAGLGTSLPIIGAALGHRDPKATAVYSRLCLAPVREAIERATAAMLEAGGVAITKGGGRDDS